MGGMGAGAKVMGGVSPSGRVAGACHAMSSCVAQKVQDTAPRVSHCMHQRPGKLRDRYMECAHSTSCRWHHGRAHMQNYMGATGPVANAGDTFSGWWWPTQGTPDRGGGGQHRGYLIGVVVANTGETLSGWWWPTQGIPFPGGGGQHRGPLIGLVGSYLMPPPCSSWPLPWPCPDWYSSPSQASSQLNFRSCCSSSMPLTACTQEIYSQHAHTQEIPLTACIQEHATVGLPRACHCRPPQSRKHLLCS